jgi:phosphotransferase system enzyme I (PtsP)
MLASGGLIDPSQYGDLASVGRQTHRHEGQKLVEGVAIGRAWLHEPRVEVTRLLADDPEAEHRRLSEAVRQLRAALDEMLQSTDLLVGEQREVLEAYRMFAHDTGWLRRIREAVDSGLSAEAAVRRAQEETRLRIGHASDPYLRERLSDLDDLANRLLRHLAGHSRSHDAASLPDDVILVARNLSAADLIEYDRSKLRGIILEEGSKTAHVTIVARAFDVAMIGRVPGAMSSIDPGSLVIVDGENGHLFVRPGEDMLQTYQQVIRGRVERRRFWDALRELPSVTRDGMTINLYVNCAFLIDVTEIRGVGADGCGLYRTELAFMSRSRFPDTVSQTEYYRQVLDAADGKRVAFRTLDVGSDKHLPYWRLPEEDNPALGWRALRLGLDRPSMLRSQLRAMLRAAAGRTLTLMFPMVAEIAELDAVRHLLDLELARLDARGEERPERLEIGAMFEVPALFWQLKPLLSRVDFVSVGTNDLMQFLFACDRGNPALTDRYDVLSPSALSFFRDLVGHCRAAGVRLSICGEMASRPLEAMALAGLGIRELSLAGSEIGPVKAMVRSLEAGPLGNYIRSLLDLPDHSLRGRLQSYARDHQVVLPNSVYEPL